MKDKFYKCVCGCKVLSVSKITDYAEVTEIELAMYGYGTGDRKTSFREKIRWCWKILTTGNGWEDEIILSEKDTKKLIKTLEKAIK